MPTTPPPLARRPIVASSLVIGAESMPCSLASLSFIVCSLVFERARALPFLLVEATACVRRPLHGVGADPSAVEHPPGPSDTPADSFEELPPMLDRISYRSACRARRTRSTQRTTRDFTGRDASRTSGGPVTHPSPMSNLTSRLAKLG